MRKLLAAIAVTIIAGAHMASFVINPEPRETPKLPLQKIEQQLAQGWGEGPRYWPRRDEPPPWERQWQGPYREPNAGIYDPEWRDPMDADLNRLRRRWQWQHAQPRYPW